MSTPSKRLATLYLTVVFVAGGAFGFSVSRFYDARIARADADTTPAEYRRKLLADLDQQLNLDDDQEQEILLILDEVGERFHEIRDAMEPEFEAIRKERSARIMALLTPAQRDKYALILEERQRRREEKAEEHRQQMHKKASSPSS